MVEGNSEIRKLVQIFMCYKLKFSENGNLIKVYINNMHFFYLNPPRISRPPLRVDVGIFDAHRAVRECYLFLMI